MNTHKDTLLKALEKYRGNGLERAERIFKDFTFEQMNTEYSLSGKTARQILNEYKLHEQEVNCAIEWVEDNL